MSQKRSVPTFRIYTRFIEGQAPLLEGPVLSPDKVELAQNLGELHHILARYEAIVCYAQTWWYVPRHTILRVCGGTTRFSLPWPLVDQSPSEPSLER